MDLNNKIVFRADGNSDFMGLGHIMRCIHLAREFEKNNFKCTFIAKDFPEAVNKIAENDYKVEIIPADIDVEEEICFIENILRSSVTDIVILDRRNLVQDYLDKLKSKVKKLVIISDVDKLDFKDLLVINVNDTVTYGDIVNGLSCIGSTYAIISDDLFKYREGNSINKDVKSVIISLGGSDAKNLTKKVIGYLDECDGHYNVTAILGPKYKFIEEVRLACNESRHTVRIIQNPESIGKYFAKADIIINTGGVTKYEVAFLGIPSIVLCQNKSENYVTESFKKNNTLINLGEGVTVKSEEFIKSFNFLAGDFSLRSEMAENGRKLIDGLGKKRIVKRVEKYIES